MAIIYYGQVANIKIGTKVGVLGVTFTEMMSEYVGKIIKLRRNIKEGLNSEDWYTDMNHGDIGGYNWHKSWFDFIGKETI